MRIKYVSEDGLNTIKTNLSEILKETVQERKFTISELFDDPYFVKSSQMEIEDFELDMSQPKGKESLTDLENVKRVYNHMRFLSNSQASDERIWAAYTFSEFIDYMKYRWPAKNVKDLENRYLFGYGIQRSLFRNGISRLWWIGRVTYDINRLNPYELTEFICQDQDFIESICGRNVFNNPKIANATITALYDAKNKGIKITENTVRNVGKYLNLLSGTYMIDLFAKDEIYAKVLNRLETDQIENY